MDITWTSQLSPKFHQSIDFDWWSLRLLPNHPSRAIFRSDDPWRVESAFRKNRGKDNRRNCTRKRTLGREPRQSLRTDLPLIPRLVRGGPINFERCWSSRVESIQRLLTKNQKLFWMPANRRDSSLPRTVNAQFSIITPSHRATLRTTGNFCHVLRAKKI